MPPVSEPKRIDHAGKLLTIYGYNRIEPEAISQIKRALELDVSVGGVLCGDAHTGYGLPIGGVLATDNAVVPYGVGMDISCGMMLSVFPGRIDIGGRGYDPIKRDEERYIEAIETNTAFGVGSSWKKRKDHAVMHESWAIGQELPKYRDLAWEQLGSSGSGNHFCEIVEFTLLDDDLPNGSLEKGTYVALLSHSGSRGVGGKMAKYYTDLAQRMHPKLPKTHRQLAWLDLDTNEGQEYWLVMELMGRYARANHDLIHQGICDHLGIEPIYQVTNHHNLAWKERYGDDTLIVHRKGATPAFNAATGLVPGSMATPGYLVRGKGNVESYNSCSHGAGRTKSRKATKESNDWAGVEKLLKRRRVKLISAGLDECPNGYKDIEAVMEAQKDLVHILGVMHPRIVKMAGEDR